MNNKLLIVGWGRCGKDEAAGFFNDHLGLPYAGSTSWAALPLIASKLGIHPQLAWEQRHQNRQLWKECCDEARKEDPLFLVRRALFGSHIGRRVVTGIRDKVEITAAKEAKIFRHILWIERPGIPADPTVTFDARDATDWVMNDGDLRRFHRNLVRWAISVNFEIAPSAYATSLLLDPIP